MKATRAYIWAVLHDVCDDDETRVPSNARVLSPPAMQLYELPLACGAATCHSCIGALSV